MQSLLLAFEWIKANPWETIQWIIFVWSILNIVWAQWPRPKSPKAEVIWKFVHHVFQLIVTAAQAKGTFTWPLLARVLLRGMLTAPDPFEVPKTSSDQPKNSSE